MGHIGKGFTGEEPFELGPCRRNRIFPGVGGRRKSINKERNMNSPRLLGEW